MTQVSRQADQRRRRTLRRAGRSDRATGAALRDGAVFSTDIIPPPWFRFGRRLDLHLRPGASAALPDQLIAFISFQLFEPAASA